MPIYEYQCPKCRRVSTFLVRNTAEHRTPACPHCGHKKLSRALSRFAPVGGKKGGKRKDEAAEAAGPTGAELPGGPDMMGGGLPGGGAGEGPMPDLGEMESMLGGLDENDPRSMGRVMRTLAEKTGEKLDGEMEEVVRRLESGEDPDKIEEKMGDALGGPEGGAGGGGDELYDG